MKPISYKLISKKLRTSLKFSDPNFNLLFSDWFSSDLLGSKTFFNNFLIGSF